MSMVGREDHAA